MTEPIECGVIIDALPTVMEDGYTINMRVVATVPKFLGYDDTRTNRVAVYVNGKQKWVNPPRPNMQKREMASTVNVWDGQTVVLGGLLSETLTTIKDAVPMLGDLPLVGRFFRSESKTTWKKNLLIFVTPTIIDPAGNRVHAVDEMPLPRGGTPPQPAR